MVVLALRMFNWSENAIARVRLLSPRGHSIRRGDRDRVLMATAFLRG